MTRDELPAGLSSREIDAAVRDRTSRGEAIYALDEGVLADLEPDLIVTQELCPVCAVSYEEVVAIAQDLPSCPQIIALDPKTFGETMGDIRTLAQATGARSAALDLVARQRSRVDAVRVAVKDAPTVPVVALEWLDPVFVAGHWTPQLIAWAGGIDVLGFAGEPSEQLSWAAVAAAEPELALVMPCGYDAERSLLEARAHADELRGLGARRVVAIDASATFSRPGTAPRGRARDPRPRPPPAARAAGAGAAARGRALSGEPVRSRRRFRRPPRRHRIPSRPPLQRRRPTRASARRGAHHA